MNKFTLTINLGNSDMRTKEDVAWLLNKLAHEIADSTEEFPNSFAIDLNGNKVWAYKFSLDD